MKNYTAEFGKETLNFKVPEDWGDVSFKDFLSFYDHKDDLGFVISTVTGLPTDFINNPDYAEFAGKLIETINDLGDMPDMDQDPKAVWTYNDTRTNIELKDFKWTVSFNQQIDAVFYGNSIQKKDSDGKAIDPTDQQVLSIFPNLCSIFMQPYFTGKDYDKKEADKLVEFFENYSFAEVVKLGRFFLSKLMKLKGSSMDSYLKASTKKKSWRWVLKFLGKPLENIRCYIRYQKAVRLLNSQSLN